MMPAAYLGASSTWRPHREDGIEWLCVLGMASLTPAHRPTNSRGFGVVCCWVWLLGLICGLVLFLPVMWMRTGS